MRLVMKFGGVLMGKSENIKHCVKLVASEVEKENQVVAVVSAMSGVTDSLLEAAEKAEQGDEVGVSEIVAQLELRHYTTAKELSEGDAELRSQLTSKIQGLAQQLRQVLSAVSSLKELTPRSKDLIVSFGERMAAPLLWAALRVRGIPSVHLTGGEAGIITNSVFGSAKPLMEETTKRVQERLLPLLEKGVVPVVTGFIGEDPNGVITTLGRGGSDYTATILAAALDADEVWIWKEVDGVMTADPKIVSEAKTIPEISYAEVMELAYFGAKVLHPLTVTPVQSKGIPIRIKNAFKPEHPGTLVASSTKNHKMVKAITAIKKTAIITTGGAGMVGVPSVVERVFSALSRKGVDVLMISQSSSMANISMVVQKRNLETALQALKEEFKENDVVREITVQDNVGVVAVVGEGMKGTPGVAAKVFSAVAEKGINILMIAQGSSELNISFAIEEKDVDEAVRTIHKAFQLGSS